jgi:hypothetical protein
MSRPDRRLPAVAYCGAALVALSVGAYLFDPPLVEPDLIWDASAAYSVLSTRAAWEQFLRTIPRPRPDAGTGRWSWTRVIGLLLVVVPIVLLWFLWR